MAELTGFQDRGVFTEILAPAESVICEKAVAKGVSHYTLDARRAFFPMTVFRLCAQFRRSNPQIVNTHSSRDGYVVGMAARIARVPFLIRSRHIDVSYPNPYISRHAFTTFADHILTTSDKITNGLIETFGLDLNCVTTVPTGIDLKRFQPKGPIAELSNVSGSNNTFPVSIGMISVLRSWKGHAIFIEAIKLARKNGVSLQGFIVGDGPQKKNIEELIAATKQSNAIKLLGYREDIPELLRALDILVIPSTDHEGIPQIGLQALACGTAVIGSNVGGIPEIIIPGKTGRIAKAKDACALAQCINDTITEKRKTDSYIEAGKSMVSKYHSREYMLNKLEKIYEGQLGNRWRG